MRFHNRPPGRRKSIFQTELLLNVDHTTVVVINLLYLSLTFNFYSFVFPLFKKSDGFAVWKSESAKKYKVT